MQSLFDKSYWLNLYKTVLLSMNQQGLDIQLLLCSVCILIALLSSKLLQRVLARKYPTGSAQSWFSLNAAPELLSPAMMLAGLMVAMWISSFFVTINKHMMAGLMKTTLAWLICRGLMLLTRRHFLGYVASFVLMTVTLLSAFRLLEPAVNFLNDITLETSTFKLSLLGVLKGILSMIFLFWGAGVLGKSGETWVRTLNFSFNARELTVKFLRIALYFVAIVLTLNQIGVDLTAFTVFGGALGVGLGFGLQKITSNFISGIILLFEKTIIVGDLIEVGTEKGWVRQMAIRHTLIETFDGREMLIPNEELIIGRVTNWTYTNTRARAEILAGITYQSDAEKAIELMVAAAKQCRQCLSDPSAVCTVKEFTDRGVLLQLNFWIGDVKSGLGASRSEVMRTILRSFKEAEIQFFHL